MGRVISWEGAPHNRGRRILRVLVFHEANPDKEQSYMETENVCGCFCDVEGARKGGQCVLSNDVSLWVRINDDN